MHLCRIAVSFASTLPRGQVAVVWPPTELDEGAHQLALVHGGGLKVVGHSRCLLWLVVLGIDRQDFRAYDQGQCEMSEMTLNKCSTHRQ